MKSKKTKLEIAQAARIKEFVRNQKMFVTRIKRLRKDLIGMKLSFDEQFNRTGEEIRKRIAVENELIQARADITILQKLSMKLLTK